MKRIIERLERMLDAGGTKKDIALLAVSGVFLILSLLKDSIPAVGSFARNVFDPSWVAIVLCGVPIVLEAIIGLVTAFDIKADVLVSMALIASVCIGEDFAAGEVAFIMQLGALLEDLTVAKARAGIEKLVHLTPQTARVISNGRESIVPVEEVKVGDVLRVLPGETIPVDGTITQGQTSINQAVMTGESLPVDKTVGDAVTSGTTNQFGAFEMVAAKVGEDSSLQRMIKLVKSADAGKAKIVGVADRWATWIVVTALTAAALAWIFTGQIIRAVTILVVFCPCSLVLATPTAIMAAIGNATKHGFLVRQGDALERLAKARIVTFDKTGTLTYGKPEVVAVEPCVKGSDSDNLSSNDLYGLCAAAEQLSEHPLGQAVVECYRKAYPSKTLPEASSFEMIPGQGVKANIQSHLVCAGNLKLMAAIGVDIHQDAMQKADENLSKGCSVIFVAVDGTYIGFIALADTVRNESAAMVKELKDMGVKPVLLTGDNPNSAWTIAKGLRISEIHANCLPEDKLNHIGTYQKNGLAVCMVGDGINDAPALKKADIGIAMGGIGSDIAVDAADIALVDDEVKELPHLLMLSRRMMKTIAFNMTFSMTLNVIAIVLAIIGTLNPVVGALVHNAGSVFVITNSAFLLNWKRRRK